MPLAMTNGFAFKRQLLIQEKQEIILCPPVLPEFGHN